MHAFSPSGPFEEQREAAAARSDAPSKMHLPARYTANGSRVANGRRLSAAPHRSTASVSWSKSFKSSEYAAGLSDAPGLQSDLPTRTVKSKLTSMLLTSFLAFLALGSAALGFRGRSALGERTLTPHQAVLSDNLTDQVQWDEFSLIVKGQRVFLQCVPLL